MTKIKLLIISVVALVAINIGLIAFIFASNRMHPPKSDGPKNFIVNKLGLDETQVKVYDNLIVQHQKSIQNEEEDKRLLKKELYSYLKSDNSVEQDSVFQRLSEVQKRIEKIHFDHFLEIKKLCRKEQIPAFNELSNELGELFSMKQPPKRKK